MSLSRRRTNIQDEVWVFEADEQHGNVIVTASIAKGRAVMNRGVVLPT